RSSTRGRVMAAHQCLDLVQVIAGAVHHAGNVVACARAILRGGECVLCCGHRTAPLACAPILAGLDAWYKLAVYPGIPATIMRLPDDHRHLLGAFLRKHREGLRPESAGLVT